MAHEIALPPESDFAALGFEVLRFGDASLALRREPFRASWVFTQLVTFVFVIRKQVTSWDELAADYDGQLAFAARNKKTFLPRGLQCGYALLPVYVGTGFPVELEEAVRTRFEKRWCVMHVPSLLDVATGKCSTLSSKHIWGAIYRGYVQDTIKSVAELVSRTAAGA